MEFTSIFYDLNLLNHLIRDDVTITQTNNAEDKNSVNIK
jgi:hypothetical protein